MQIKYSNIGTIEPVLLADAKAWLKAEDYDTDDAMITSLITGVRGLVEEFTGLSLVDKTIEYFEDDVCELTNDAGRIEVALPYPEHDTIVEVKVDGTEVTDYVSTGLTRKIITLNNTFSTGLISDKGLYIKYTTLANCQEGIRQAMLKQIEDVYEHRGNNFEGSIAQLNENCFAYTNIFWI